MPIFFLLNLLSVRPVYRSMARATWLFLLGWVSFAFAFDCQSKDYLKPSNAALRPWTSEPQKIAFMLNLNEIAGGEKAPQRCVSELLSAWKTEKLRLESHANAEPWHDLVHLVQSSPVTREAPREGSECRAAATGCGSCHLPRVNNCTYRISVEEGTKKRTIEGSIVEANASGVTLSSRCVECAEVRNPSTGPGGDTGVEKISARDIEKTEWLNGADDLIKWWDFRTLNGRGQTARKMLAISAEQGVGCAHCHVSHGDFRLTSNGERFKATGRAR